MELRWYASSATASCDGIVVAWNCDGVYLLSQMIGLWAATASCDGKLQPECMQGH